MDQAVNQLDDTIERISEKLPLMNLANIDEFEISIRRALLIMYDEPDQWRIRALRIVMGKMMALCFPLILQSQRWAGTYQKWWGMMRVRVVADHKWLYQAGMCQKSDVIMSGFEHMDVLWVRYRKEGWKPSDDLMFPMREMVDPPTPPASAPPTPAGGKKKSKAIPIVDPTSVPGKSVSRSLGNEEKDYPHGEHMAHSTGENGHLNAKTSETRVSFDAAHSTAPKSTATATIDASPALVQSSLNFDDPFTASSSTAVIPTFADRNSLPASGRMKAHATYLPGSIFPSPFFMRPRPAMAMSLPVSPQRTLAARNFPSQADQPNPVLPWLPDGPFYFAETSTGQPANKFAPSVTGGSSSTAPASASVIRGPSSSSTSVSSIDVLDSLDSPTRRMTELQSASDGSYSGPVDPNATPRAVTGSLTKYHEKASDQTKSDATMSIEDEATPRALVPDQRIAYEAVAEQFNIPTAIPTTRKNKERKKKARKFTKKHSSVDKV